MWTEECNITFEELKKYLVHPPLLSRPEKEEVLYAYIAITNHAASLVLVRTGPRVQKLIYYVSKSHTIVVPITFKPILLLSSPSFPYKYCFGD